MYSNRKLTQVGRLQMKQGVVLTGRDTAGPPLRASPWCVTLRRRGVLQTTTGRQTPTNKTILAPYTMCRRASKKESPLPLTDPRVAEAQRMLNIPYRIIW